MGHEERFLPSRLSAGFLLRKETVARRRRNGRGAPTAVISAAAIDPLSSTAKLSFGIRKTSATRDLAPS